jgi:hypothetical protein
MVQQEKDQYGAEQEPFLFRSSGVWKIKAVSGLQVGKEIPFDR